MVKQVFSIVMVATLLSISSGCSGMQNFLFGRGARCGLCSSGPDGGMGPQFGNVMQAPCGQAPGRQGGCGPGPFAGGGCQDPGRGGFSGGSQFGGDCSCHYADPYMSSGVVGVPPSGQTFAPIQGDDFRARRFDNDGSQIIWEGSNYGGTSL